MKFMSTVGFVLLCILATGCGQEDPSEHVLSSDARSTDVLSIHAEAELTDAEWSALMEWQDALDGEMSPVSVEKSESGRERVRSCQACHLGVPQLNNVLGIEGAFFDHGNGRSSGCRGCHATYSPCSTSGNSQTSGK